MANFGDILSSLTLAANQSVRRNAGDTAFEAFTAQTLDATLTALAAQNWAANAIPIGSGADTLSQVSFAANTFPARASTGNLVAKTITDFGLSLVDDANAAAARTTLGLGALAVEGFAISSATSAPSFSIATQSGLFAAGSYSSLSEGGGGLSNILGHNIRASTSVNNQVQKYVNATNPGQFIKQNVLGISFHTGVGATDAIGTQYADTVNARMFINQTGEVGINTTAPATKLTVGGTESATLTDFTQTVANNAIAILSAGGTYPRYTPGFMWYTTSHPTKPKSGIWTENTNSGSFIYLGTSNSYATGITNQAVTINPSGHVGILTVAPTARFHISAGSATANTAPLKLTTGTVNTTAEAGAIEYNNTFHVTNSDATRRHIATAPNTTKVTAGAPYTNDGYVVINIGGTDFKVMTTA